MIDLQAAHLGGIIKSATTPALLMAAVVLQLRVLNNRLSRIIDREQLVRAAGDSMARAEARHELEVLEQRQRAIQRAIFLCVSGALMVCLVIALLFAEDLLGADLPAALAFLFVAAMACLVLSYLLFLDEIFLSIRKMRLTIRGSRQARRWFRRR